MPDENQTQGTTGPVAAPKVLCHNDLLLFAGMAVLLIVTGIVSYWIVEFRPYVIAAFAGLFASAQTYLRGK